MIILSIHIDPVCFILYTIYTLYCPFPSPLLLVLILLNLGMVEIVGSVLLFLLLLPAVLVLLLVLLLLLLLVLLLCWQCWCWCWCCCCCFSSLPPLLCYTIGMLVLLVVLVVVLLLCSSLCCLLVVLVVVLPFCVCSDIVLFDTSACLPHFLYIKFLISLIPLVSLFNLTKNYFKFCNLVLINALI
jgi:hypothetical protein